MILIILLIGIVLEMLIIGYGLYELARLIKAIIRG